MAAWATARVVGVPLGRLAAVLQRIAGGDAAVPVPDRARHDEIGRIAEAVEALRATVGAAFAQKQMIEQMPVGVMRADPAQGFRIDYMNAEMHRILDSVPHVLPCPPAEVLGQSLDIFHRNPAHQRALLSDPSRLPHHARIRVAGGDGPHRLRHPWRRRRLYRPHAGVEDGHRAGPAGGYLRGRDGQRRGQRVRPHRGITGGRPPAG
ncbi:HAMP domain-containing protein [Pseudoroseomonas wenyumeiae]